MFQPNIFQTGSAAGAGSAGRLRNLYLLPLLVGLMLTLLTGCPDSRSPQPDGQSGDPTPRHLRIVWTEDPAHHAIVSWTTLAPASSGVIHYDTESRRDSETPYRFSAPVERSGEVTLLKMDRTEGVPPGWYHHGQISDLPADSKIFLRVESDGVFSEEFYFITAHSGDKPYKLLSGGDSRLGGEKPRYAGRTPHVERQGMNRRMAQLLEENPDILALVHGADWGTTAEWRHLYWWFEDHEILQTTDKRLLPLIVSRGNHDEAVGFQENFWLADITDAFSFGYYYTTLLGDLALITLNTEISVAGDQREWLEEELVRLTNELDPEPRWLLAQYHRPAYPVAKPYDRHHFRRVREAWTPLFDQFDLDLVLESDGHVLKRTVPIRNFQPAEDGVVYIGEGGLGVPQRVPIENLWYVAAPGMAASAHHVWMLSISPQSLTMEAVGIDGKILDRHTIAPRDRSHIVHQIPEDDD